MNPKTVAHSCTEQVQIVMPEHINSTNRLFGGRLMEWVDIVAAVVARRHSGCNVTTVAIDNLHFQAAAYVNDTLVLAGRITHTGTSSMEVRVDTYVEDLAGTRRMINRAYLVLVALDQDERPTPVPDLILETEEDRQEWDHGQRRRELRGERRSVGY